MINKQNLWFITLFSLILILGIYYISIDDEVVSVLKSENNNDRAVIEISESDLLVALEVEKEEEKQALLTEYQNVLLDVKSTMDQKNKAYEDIQKLNESISEEEKIKKVLMDEFDLKGVSKIDGNNIQITIASNKHSVELANKIMRRIQSIYNGEKYITVKFNA